MARKRTIKIRGVERGEGKFRVLVSGKCVHVANSLYAAFAYAKGYSGIDLERSPTWTGMFERKKGNESTAKPRIEKCSKINTLLSMASCTK